MSRVAVTLALLLAACGSHHRAPEPVIEQSVAPDAAVAESALALPESCAEYRRHIDAYATCPEASPGSVERFRSDLAAIIESRRRTHELYRAGVASESSETQSAEDTELSCQQGRADVDRTAAASGCSH
jgi:hypothetical protein